MFLNLYISMYCFALITPLVSSKNSCACWKCQGSVNHDPLWHSAIWWIGFDVYVPNAGAVIWINISLYNYCIRDTFTLWPDTILMNAILITWTRKILFINWLNIKANYIVHFTCDIIIKLHTPKCCILEMTVSWKWDAWPREVWNPTWFVYNVLKN